MREGSVTHELSLRQNLKEAAYAIFWQKDPENQNVNFYAKMWSEWNQNESSARDGESAKALTAVIVHHNLGALCLYPTGSRSISLNKKRAEPGRFHAVQDGDIMEVEGEEEQGVMYAFVVQLDDPSDASQLLQIKSDISRITATTSASQQALNQKIDLIKKEDRLRREEQERRVREVRGEGELGGCWG